MAKNGGLRRRRIVQWCVLPVVIMTIGLGWKYPLLGFSVPIVMIMGMVGALFRGRYVCGNLCPRGGFLDRIIRPISLKRDIPPLLRNNILRWILFAALMGFMIFRILQNPASVEHWGRVFWLMCVITTGLGVILGILIHPRAWCSFCPMGTMQNALGGGRHQLRINTQTCRECGLCEKACPFALKIVKHKPDGFLPNRDCLRCSECVAVCPVKALSWPEKAPRA